MGRLSFQATVKVNQKVSVKRTIQLSGAGLSLAAMIIGLFVFTRDMTNSSDVKANEKKKTDSLYSAPNINRGDSLVNNNSSQSGIHSEDQNHLLTDADLIPKKVKKKSNSDADRNIPYQDMISISPKQTSGVFEVSYEIPISQSGSTSIELINRKGEVIETRVPQVQDKMINEVFTLDNSIPTGAYLLKIHVGKNLYVRQVFYTKP